MPVASTKPMTETPDPQLQLKKRARRRLVGAVAFAGLAAVILPMVMDEEPKQQVPDVQIKIPGQDQVPPFKPAEPPARSAGAPTAQVGDPSPAVDKPATDEPQATASKVPAAAATAAAVPGTAIAGKAVADKLAEKKAATPPAKTNGRKSAETKPAKPADKAQTPAASKPRDKATGKPAEKPAPKKADKPAETAPADETGRAGDEAQRANALLSGKTPETAPTKSGGGRHLIMAGAFANAENAKQLQARLGAAGVRAYTEVLNSPDGSKKTRVRAGPFPSREAAEKALDKMKRMGVSGVVTSRE